MAELESSLAQVKLPVEHVPLLAPLLDIPLPPEHASTLPPEELRRRALTNWVMAGARVQAVVLALEDLHWADPTTLEVLRSIAERGAAAEMALHREEVRLLVSGFSATVVAFLHWTGDSLIALWRECPDVCTVMPHFSGLGGLDLAGPVRGLWMCNFARLAAAPSCFPNSEPNSFAVKLGATYIVRQLGG